MERSLSQRSNFDTCQLYSSYGKVNLKKKERRRKKEDKH